MREELPEVVLTSTTSVDGTDFLDHYAPTYDTPSETLTRVCPALLR